MKHQVLPLIVLAAALTGCDRADTSVKVDEGAALFAANCAVCHGPAGDVRNADMHDADTPDLRKIAKESPGGRLPRAAMAEIIDGRRVIEGHARSMPTWGETLGQGDDTVAKEKIDKLIAYIESIQES
jgi:mono/diheme cytochrome c family protein